MYIIGYMYMYRPVQVIHTFLFGQKTTTSAPWTRKLYAKYFLKCCQLMSDKAPKNSRTKYSPKIKGDWGSCVNARIWLLCTINAQIQPTAVQPVSRSHQHQTESRYHQTVGQDYSCCLGHKYGRKDLDEQVKLTAFYYSHPHS